MNPLQRSGLALMLFAMYLRITADAVPFLQIVAMICFFTGAFIFCLKGS